MKLILKPKPPKKPNVQNPIPKTVHYHQGCFDQRLAEGLQLVVNQPDCYGGNDIFLGDQELAIDGGLPHTASIPKQFLRKSRCAQTQRRSGPKERSSKTSTEWLKGGRPSK